MTDWELIQRYRDDSSHAAFTEIVERHMKLVYWTCRRELACDALAEDATQAVFILLARKANSLKRGTSVSGWLFHTARFAARTLQRSEQRRQRHEKEAAFVNATQSRHGDEWLRIEPRLNEALAALPSTDRDVLLLRFFDGLSLREVADEIGTTEDTARKRVSRALERMRRSLFRKEAAITGLALGALLGSHLARAVPLATHKATLASLPSWLSSSASPLPQALIGKQGAYFIMQATKQKIIAASIAVILLGAVITLPIAGWKIYHARTLAAEIGAGGFTDESTLPSSGVASITAHQEIVADYKAIVDGFNKRDFSPWVSSIAPDAVIKTWSGGVITRDQGIAGDQQQLASHPEAKSTGTLQSLTINGDQAIGTFATRWVQITTAQDMKAPGHLDVSDETFRMNWEKRAGKWLVVQSNTVSHEEHIQ